MWWSLLMEGLLSTGPTPSSMYVWGQRPKKMFSQKSIFFLIEISYIYLGYQAVSYFPLWCTLQNKKTLKKYRDNIVKALNQLKFR